jgi:hypothetical protein
VGHKYGRPGAVAAIGLPVAVLLALLVAPAAVLAADPPADVVLDATVTVHHVDASDGAIAGATITVVSYRDPELPIQVLTATTDPEGVASLSGIARPADGAAPVLLDVRSDLLASTVDEAGCTETESWFAMKVMIPAAPAVEVVLDSTAKSLEVSCPEPTDPPAGTGPSAEPPQGGVLAATGRPRITPPSTDTVPMSARPATHGTSSGVLAALLTAAGLLVVPAALAHARLRRRR